MNAPEHGPDRGIALLDKLLTPVRGLVRFPATQVEAEESERTPMLIAVPKLLEKLFRPSGVSGALEHPCELAHTWGVHRRQGIPFFNIFQSLCESLPLSAQEAQKVISCEEALVDLQNLVKFGLCIRGFASRSETKRQAVSKLYIERILLQRPPVLFHCLEYLARRQ